MYHTSLQNKQTKKRSKAAFIKFWEWPSFNTIYIYFKMYLFKKALITSFLALTLYGLLSFVKSLKSKGWLRKGSPDLWSLAQRRWDGAKAERTVWTGLTGACFSYPGAANKSEDNLHVEILHYPSEMEYEVGGFLGRNGNRSNNNKNNNKQHTHWEFFIIY